VARTGAARPEEIRRHNLGLLLEQVHRDGELTRAELTQRLGLNRSTIGALVAELTELGLIDERVPTGNERAGRPSHVVAPRADGPFAIAVEVDVDSVVTAAVTLGGDVLARYDHNLPAHGTTPYDIAARIAADVEELFASLPLGARSVGIGVSTPGTVAPTTGGRVEHAPNLEWRDEPFGAILAERLPPGIAVAFGNDANLGALAEHLRGAARGFHDAVYLTGKIGVGGGVIVDGKLLSGAGGFAGEVGHMLLDPSGPPCHCGSRGCVETYVGEEALLRLAGRKGPPTRESVAEVMCAARAGEPDALRGVRAVGVALGRTIANLVNLLNPQVVITGGSLATVLELCRAEVEHEIDERAMSEARRSVQLRTAGLGENSSLIGGAELAFGPLLADPVGTSVPPERADRRLARPTRAAM
jgi:predicted NBD/HSP70 family sugar kinase